KVEVKNTDGMPVDRWKVESTASAVVSVEKFSVEDKRLTAELVAHAEGEARIRLVDASGTELRSATVNVKAPDRARVLSHAMLRLLGRNATSIDSAEVSEARIVAAGKGVYAILYLRGTERVFGRGILAVDAPAEVKVENETTSGVFTNEWMFVTPSVAGA